MGTSNPSKLGIGVIGVGGMGKRHAENVRRHIPTARLVAIADTDSARVRSLAAELEIAAAYDSTEALLEDREVHAVVIASSSKFHAPLIELAAKSGKDIFCEKPLALTLQEADRALAAVAHSGVLFQIGLMRRFDPAYAAAKKKIDEGAIGRPVIFKSLGRDRDCPAPSLFQTDSEPALIFAESAIHDFDLARWLMSDEVAEVFALGGALGSPELARLEQIDSSLVSLKFAKGAIGSVENFWGAGYGYDIRTEVVGTLGTLAIGTLGGDALIELKQGGTGRPMAQDWLERFTDAYRLELEAFVHSVQTGSAPAVTGEDGRRSLVTALAAVKSWKESRPVSLP
jgi:predicted dehydrogenase